MDTYQFLSKISPFHMLARQQLRMVAGKYQRKRIPAGHILIEQKKPVEQVGIIQSGSAKVTVIDHGGDELTCGFLLAGDFVFNLSVFSGTMSNASVTSLEPTVCLMQSKQLFIDMINAYPQLKNFFYRNAILGVRQGYELFRGRYGIEVSDQADEALLPSFIHKALAYIDSNYDKPINLEDVAKAVAMSRFHFSRLFKQHMGPSFKRYINLKRIEVAKGLISKKGYNVTEAGYAVGFNDASYFTRVFRDLTGRSPKSFVMHG